MRRARKGALPPRAPAGARWCGCISLKMRHFQAAKQQVGYAGADSSSIMSSGTWHRRLSRSESSVASPAYPTRLQSRKSARAAIFRMIGHEFGDGVIPGTETSLRRLPLTSGYLRLSETRGPNIRWKSLRLLQGELDIDPHDHAQPALFGYAVFKRSKGARSSIDGIPRLRSPPEALLVAEMMRVSGLDTPAERATSRKDNGGAAQCQQGDATLHHFSRRLPWCYDTFSEGSISPDTEEDINFSPKY